MLSKSPLFDTLFVNKKRKSENFYRGEKAVGLHYSFDRDLASRIGLNEAILLHGIGFWADRNLKNNHNIFDGFVWVYNSIKAWQELFPFWSADTIRRTLKSLEVSGYIVSGNYNQRKADRTKWYALTETGAQCLGFGLPSSFMQNAQMQNAKCDEVAAKCANDLCKLHSPFMQNAQMGENGANPDGERVADDNASFPFMQNAQSVTSINNIIQYKQQYKHNNITPLTPQGGESEKTKSGDTVKNYDEWFNRFWQAYPKHAGKEQARKAFRRLAPSESLLNTMLDAIETQKSLAQWQRDNGQYIPMPATWLNQKRWEDEIPSAPTQSEQANEAQRALAILNELHEREEWQNG